MRRSVIQLHKNNVFSQRHSFQTVDCGALDDPNNGQVSHNETTVGSDATYTCDPGFMLIGNMIRICQASGIWSGDEPVCQSQFRTITVACVYEP